LQGEPKVTGIGFRVWFRDWFRVWFRNAFCKGNQKSQVQFVLKLTVYSSFNRNWTRALTFFVFFYFIWQVLADMVTDGMMNRDRARLMGG